MVFHWRIFWPILIILLSIWSPLDLLFPPLPVPLPSFWGLYRVHELQLVSLSCSCSIDFFNLLKGLGTYLSFRFHSFLLRRQSPLFGRFSFFSWLTLGLIIWARFDDLFASKILGNFVRLILKDGFRIVHIPFVCMVKFKFLAQFPNDPFPHLVVCSFKYFLG